MSLLLRDISLRLDEEESLLPDKIAIRLDINPDRITAWRIVRKGIDARRKPEVMRIYTVEFSCAGEDALLSAQQEIPGLEKMPEPGPLILDRISSAPVVIVVGMGPAGLFSALCLAEAGARVVLLERGRPVEERLHDVQNFWAGGPLNTESNIQFGEGGAGTFSDGKLTSRINHPAMRHVLERLVEFGAPQEILWQAKPHVGSDRLRKVMIRFRRHLASFGVDIRFSSRLTGLDVHDGRVVAGVVNATDRISCDRLVLAPGHSARDTYRMLREHEILLEKKPFAIGLRVEHPRELINSIQYGLPSHPALPAADYRLTWNNPKTGRGVYSFCMCPGGTVINASSEPDGIVVNGMSEFSRDAAFSNSALVVSVSPADFPGTDPLAGVRFQQHWERAAYRCGESGWRAPAQPLLEFIGRKGGVLLSSCRPQVVAADLQECLPHYVTTELLQALPYFERKMRGFICREASLIGVETRTSAPLRIVRDAHGESVSCRGLYPAGEGAGYAGGIMSAAVDGIRIASAIIQTYADSSGFCREKQQRQDH